MSCEISAKFYGVNSLNDNFYLSCLEDNLKSFLDYGFLNIGGFVNINIPTSGLYDNTFSQLKYVDDPGHQQKRVWQTPKKDWVWETGINYNDSSPVNISGVYVDDIFYPAPSGSGNLTYTLDYNNGQVIFDRDVSKTANINMSYSYRWCQVIKSTNNDGWKYLQNLTYQPNDSISTPSIGDNAIISKHRVQMPCIVIEIASRNKDAPYELGSLVAFRDQDIILNIYTENINDLNTIMDIIRYQKDRTINLYDIKKVVNLGLYGLNGDGSKNDTGLNYSDIINNSSLLWNKLFVKDIVFVETKKNSTGTIFWCILRITGQTIL